MAARARFLTHLLRAAVARGASRRGARRTRRGACRRRRPCQRRVAVCGSPSWTSRLRSPPQSAIRPEACSHSSRQVTTDDSLRAAAAAGGDQAAEVGVAGAGRGEDHTGGRGGGRRKGRPGGRRRRRTGRRSVTDRQFGADDEMDAKLLRLHVSADDTVHAVAVGQRDGGQGRRRGPARSVPRDGSPLRETNSCSCTRAGRTPSARFHPAIPPVPGSATGGARGRSKSRAGRRSASG